MVKLINLFLNPLLEDNNSGNYTCTYSTMKSFANSLNNLTNVIVSQLDSQKRMIVHNASG